MSEPATSRPTAFRTGGLSPRKPTRFSYRPGPEDRAALAAGIGLLSLHALELTGDIRPAGRDELVLEATLFARADQACVVTLVAVPTDIREPVRRRYVAGLIAPDGDEVEMPDDESLEPMPDVIDLHAIAAEALTLALPLYPRAPGAEFAQALHAGQGVKPLSDADLKPFAGLQDLASKLAGPANPRTKDGSDDAE